MPVCLYCGGPLPTGRKPRIFCRDKCRRKYQDARRKEERAEARLLAQELKRPFCDPWARNDLDDYTVEMICQNALMEAAPIIGPGDREETLRKRAQRERRPRTQAKTQPNAEKPASVAQRPKKKGAWLSLLDLPEPEEKKPLVQGRGWKKNWLSLC